MERGGRILPRILPRLSKKTKSRLKKGAALAAALGYLYYTQKGKGTKRKLTDLERETLALEPEVISDIPRGIDIDEDEGIPLRPPDRPKKARKKGPTKMKVRVGGEEISRPKAKAKQKVNRLVKDLLKGQKIEDIYAPYARKRSKKVPQVQQVTDEPRVKPQQIATMPDISDLLNPATDEPTPMPAATDAPDNPEEEIVPKRRITPLLLSRPNMRQTALTPQPSDVQRMGEQDFLARLKQEYGISDLSELFIRDDQIKDAEELGEPIPKDLEEHRQQAIEIQRKGRKNRSDVFDRLMEQYGSEETPYFDPTETKMGEKQSEIPILIDELEVAQSRNVDEEIKDMEHLSPSELRDMKEELLEDKMDEINDLKRRLRKEIKIEMKKTDEEGKKELEEIRRLYLV